MYLLNHVLVAIVKLIVRSEVPGWGYFYRILDAPLVTPEFWASVGPKVIRDKRTKLFYLLNLQEWADRLFFFLGRWYDLETQLVIEHILKEDDHVIDVGANYGNFALTTSAIIGEKGSILAFEPNPYAISRLQTNISLNSVSQINVLNMGLADKVGSLVLKVPKHNPGEASFANSGFSDFQEYECPIGVGDNEAAGLDKVACIKIDVEGFELRVLRGFSNLIQRDRPWIITEVVRTHLQRDGCSPEDLGAFLTPFGYAPYRIAVVGFGRWKSLSLELSDLSLEMECDILWVPEHQLSTLQSAGVKLSRKGRVS